MPKKKGKSKLEFIENPPKFKKRVNK